jgi:hypothetical protein
MYVATLFTSARAALVSARIQHFGARALMPERLVFSRWSRALAAVAVALLARDAAAQHDDEHVRDEVRACAAKHRESERLECYDALARAVEAGTPAPATAPQNADAASAPADFGFSPQRAAPAEPPPAAQEIVSTVSALREIRPGRLEITLANGQVWRQTSSDRYLLAIGHEVRVYSTRFGTYFRLSATKLRGFVQVERVR